MSRIISLVAARKSLGRIVEEVGRTGSAVSLTRRGKVIAHIVPEQRKRTRDPLAALRGSAELQGSFAELTRELRTLREEGRVELGRRMTGQQRPRAKRRA